MTTYSILFQELDRRRQSTEEVEQELSELLRTLLMTVMTDFERDPDDDVDDDDVISLLRVLVETKELSESPEIVIRVLRFRNSEFILPEVNATPLLEQMIDFLDRHIGPSHT